MCCRSLYTDPRLNRLKIKPAVPLFLSSLPLPSSLMTTLTCSTEMFTEENKTPQDRKLEQVSETESCGYMAYQSRSIEFNSSVKGVWLLERDRMIQKLHHEKTEDRTMEEGKRLSQREWCSENHWLWRFSNWTEQGPAPWRLKVCSTEVWGCDPAFWLPFIILTFTFMQSVSSRFLPNFTRPSTEVQQCLPTHQLLNHLCQETLTSAAVRNLLHCLSCWAFPVDNHGGLSSPWGSGLVNMRFLPVVWGKSHILFFSFILNAMYGNAFTNSQQV